MPEIDEDLSYPALNDFGLRCGLCPKIAEQAPIPFTVLIERPKTALNPHSETLHWRERVIAKRLCNQRTSVGIVQIEDFDPELLFRAEMVDE
jgi:hypothetical protein